MGKGMYTKGLAFIVEGDTEQVFYEEYLRKLCADCGAAIAKDEESQENKYDIAKAKGTIVAMIRNVGSVSQLVNAAIWFKRACVDGFDAMPWTVFLCYDTDGYNVDVTKFYEGDWLRLRQEIAKDAEEVRDLAAEADIEDMMLLDLKGVLAYLGLSPDIETPPGRKGKAKMRKLFRMVAPNNSYHEGDRARPLIQSLDMGVIEARAPIPLSAIGAALDSD